MIRIRDAVLDDLETFAVLGKRMYEESLEPYPPIEVEVFRKFLELAVSMPSVFMTILAEDDGIPVGMMTAVAGPYSFSSRMRTSSDLLFVLPEHRGGMASVRLVKRFKEWGDGLGSYCDTLSVATGVTPKRTGKFFKIMGFRPMEMIYRRDNVHGN